MRNIDVIEMARSNSAVTACLPPHSSHKMQPLDVAFMNPFKTHYAQEVEMKRVHPKFIYAVCLNGLCIKFILFL
jgi:hypothetical protein